MHAELKALALVAMSGLILAGAPPAGAYDVREVTQRARDLVFDPVSGNLYVSIPASAGTEGNSVRSIDPETGRLGPAVFVGSEPNQLGLSDDGTTLYVGLDGSFSIRRLALPQLTPGIEFLVQDPGTLPHFRRRAFEIEVQPGDADVIAVVRGYPDTRSVAPLAIFDNGVMRPETLGIFDSGPTAVEFSEDPSLLYAIFTGFDRLRVHENGVSQIAGRPYLQDYRSLERFDDRAYFASGWVYDIATDRYLGRYAAIAHGVIAETAAERVYFLIPGAIAVFDLERFVVLDVLPITMSGTPGNLVLWGPHRLAFTDTDHVFLVDATLPDADGDAVIDRWDNCAASVNPDQADADDDAIGDVCDVNPNESDTELAQCIGVRLEVASERLHCEDEPRFVDLDADGEHDATDHCPNTPVRLPVDETGCSLAEFCSAHASKSCAKADWRNDEPRGKPRDCVRSGSRRAGYRCEPAI